MKLHNLMEDLIRGLVEEICSEAAPRPGMEELAIEKTRLDVECYVLNRVPPRYVTSSRGLTHIDRNYTDRLQSGADLVTLIYEGIGKIIENRRAAIAEGRSTGQAVPSPAVFGFPVIKGRLLVGSTFEPVGRGTITLSIDDAEAVMYDTGWQNPFTFHPKTNGTYLFWPAPLPAERPDLERTFECVLTAQSPDFPTLEHSFRMSLVSQSERDEHPRLDRTYDLPELLLTKD